MLVFVGSVGEHLREDGEATTVSDNLAPVGVRLRVPVAKTLAGASCPHCGAYSERVYSTHRRGLHHPRRTQRASPSGTCHRHAGQRRLQSRRAPVAWSSVFGVGRLCSRSGSSGTPHSESFSRPPGRNVDTARPAAADSWNRSHPPARRMALSPRSGHVRPATDHPNPGRFERRSGSTAPTPPGAPR